MAGSQCNGSRATRFARPFRSRKNRLIFLAETDLPLNAPKELRSNLSTNEEKLSAHRDETFYRRPSRVRIERTRGRERHCTAGPRSKRSIVQVHAAERACIGSRSGPKCRDVFPATAPSPARKGSTGLQSLLSRQSARLDWPDLFVASCKQQRSTAWQESPSRLICSFASTGLPLYIINVNPVGKSPRPQLLPCR